MATAMQPTRPRLQTLGQNGGDPDEQMRQAAHIIGLPDDWESLHGQGRVEALRHVVRARAEYVLRWLLEKLKDATDDGARARGCATAWRLADWTIHVLPVSRCAPHLRDAQFPSILESTLAESFGADTTLRESATPDRHARDVSESSETMQEDPPSRKRKRTSGTSTPSKRAVLEATGSTQLFDAVTATVRSIRERAGTLGTIEDPVQAEHMQMVLRTESAQAARILKHWLCAVQQRTAPAGHSSEPFPADLSLAVDIWEMRVIDAKDDSGAALEHFATECLVPTLILSQSLQRNQFASSRDAITTLDKLLAKHVLFPSRAAFFNMLGEDAAFAQPQLPEAELLSSSLGPLRAKLLQAAQIADSGYPIPSYFSPLFASVPQLLELVIRYSPARTPKSRITERPWVQAAFVTLSKCIGCSFEAPEFKTPEPSLIALQRCLRILVSHGQIVDSRILRDLFWYHSGLTYPLKQERVIHWPLIASVIELDPTIFLVDPRGEESGSNVPEDLAKFLFDQISTYTFSSHTVAANARIFVIDQEKASALEMQEDEEFNSETVVKKIIIPVMSAFARNRDLTGFFQRWDHQLRHSPRIARRALQELGQPIWEDRSLILSVTDMFEKSLTSAQISTLFQDFATQLKYQAGSTGTLQEEAIGIDTMVQAMLESVTLDENIEILKSTFQSLMSSYTARVLSERSNTTASLGITWMNLCQLLHHLWPILLHDSASFQEQFLHPLIDRASKDISAARKDESHRRLDSYARATAIVFLLTACDCLRSLPDSGDLIRRKLRRVLKALSPKQLESKELSKVTEIFCAEYVQLLEILEPGACQSSFSSLLSTISEFDKGTSEQAATALSQSVFTHGSVTLQTAFTSALLQAIAEEDERLHSVAVNSFLQATPSSISREQREATLDSLMALDSQPIYVTASLSIMVHLMEVPNATAKLSSDGAAIPDLAQRLHDAKLESTSSLQLFQSLVRLTLSHILLNKDQSQNKRFLEKYESKIQSLSNKTHGCVPSRLALFRGTFLAADKDRIILPAQQHISLLITCLKEKIMSDQYILDGLNEIPLHTYKDNGNLFETTQTSLREWTISNLSQDSTLGIIDSASFGALPAQCWPTLHKAVAKFQLYSDTKWFLKLSSSLLDESLPANGKTAILNVVKEVLLPLETSEKLALIHSFLSKGCEEDPAVHHRILHILIGTLDNKLEADNGLKREQLALLSRICSRIGEQQDDAVFNTLLDNINIILRDKPSLTNQHGIENVLILLLKLSSRNSPRLSPIHAPIIFARLCETSRLVLLLHRSRLGGRFHLLLPLLQNLLLCLFIPNGGRGASLPLWLDPTSSSPVRLTPTNASQYTRLITTLCSPTQSSVQRSYHAARSENSASKLNDPVKAAREYASQYVYPLLSAFCRFQLFGRLESQIRDKLMAGIWEAVSVASLDRGGLDAMFAGMGVSDRDIWKGIWGEWERGASGREVRQNGEP